MKTITKVVKSCDACPSQWDLTMEDGSSLYARFRHGWFYIGQPGEPVWEHRPKDGSDGYMNTSDMIKLIETQGYRLTPDAVIEDIEWI